MTKGVFDDASRILKVFFVLFIYIISRKPVNINRRNLVWRISL